MMASLRRLLIVLSVLIGIGGTPMLNGAGIGIVPEAHAARTGGYVVVITTPTENRAIVDWFRSLDTWSKIDVVILLVYVLVVLGCFGVVVIIL